MVPEKGCDYQQINNRIMYIIRKDEELKMIIHQPLFLPPVSKLYNPRQLVPVGSFVFVCGSQVPPSRLFLLKMVRLKMVRLKMVFLKMVFLKMVLLKMVLLKMVRLKMVLLKMVLLKMVRVLAFCLCRFRAFHRCRLFCRFQAFHRCRLLYFQAPSTTHHQPISQPPTTPQRSRSKPMHSKRPFPLYVSKQLFSSAPHKVKRLVCLHCQACGSSAQCYWDSGPFCDYLSNIEALLRRLSIVGGKSVDGDGTAYPLRLTRLNQVKDEEAGNESADVYG
jgi:hypothetical protein